MSDKYLIWWTSQADCERLPEIDSWPVWLGNEYRSRQGRAGRGRLWVPDEFHNDPDMPSGVTCVWDTTNNWLCQAANDCGGVVIPADRVGHIQFVPGFVTTFAMELPALSLQDDAPQYTVSVTRDYGVSRVIVIGVSAERQNNVFVQEKVGDRWVNRSSYNSLSNDYAYSSAGDEAERIAKKIKRSMVAEQETEASSAPSK